MGKIEFDDLSLGIDVVLNRQSEKKDKKNPIESAKNGMDTEPKFWYWEPETLIGRMLSQESRFLFGPNDIPAGRFLFDIKIEEGDKEGLLWELKRLQGLRPETIFSDIHGFADANAHGKIVSKDYQKTPQRKVASKASKEADAESLEKESTQEHKKKQ